MNDTAATAATAAIAAKSGKTSGGGLTRMLIIGGIAVVSLVVGGFAGPAVKNMLSPAAAEDPPAAAAEEKGSDEPALYASLQPPLVVNLKDTDGGAHYMQLTMEVMAHDQKVIDAVKKHSPAIRNALILLFGSNVDYATVNTREGKEKMLADALQAIQKIMRDRIGIDGVDALYFTSLIIQ